MLLLLEVIQFGFFISKVEAFLDLDFYFDCFDCLKWRFDERLLI